MLMCITVRQRFTCGKIVLIFETLSCVHMLKTMPHPVNQLNPPQRYNGVFYPRHCAGQSDDFSQPLFSCSYKKGKIIHFPLISAEIHFPHIHPSFMTGCLFVLFDSLPLKKIKIKNLFFFSSSFFSFSTVRIFLFFIILQNRLLCFLIMYDSFMLSEFSSNMYDSFFVCFLICRNFPPKPLSLRQEYVVVVVFLFFLFSFS